MTPGAAYVRNFLEECRSLGELQRLQQEYRQAVISGRPVNAILRKAKRALAKLRGAD